MNFFCTQRIMLLFHGYNFEVICQCMPVKSNAEEYVVHFDEGKKNDGTENHHIAFKFYVPE